MLASLRSLNEHAEVFPQSKAMIMTLRASSSLVLAALLLAAPVVASQEQDVARDAAVRALVETTQVEQMADQMIDLFSEQIVPALVAANPGHDEQVRNLVREQVEDTLDGMREQVIDLTREVWARHFTTGEIVELTEFYRSPLGRKLLEKQPLIARESMEDGMRLSQEAARLVLDGIKSRLAAEGLTVPQRF